MTRTARLVSLVALPVSLLAVAAPAQSASATAADTAAPCIACRYRAAAAAYRRAATLTTGAWNAYYLGMARYHACIAASLTSNRGGCGDPPPQPAGSPCYDPSARGLGVCNATEPPDRTDARYVVIPDSIASIDLRTAAFTAGGAVRYVWDALHAADSMHAPDRTADGARAQTEHRRAATEHLLDSLHALADGGARPGVVYRVALDSGIALMNRAGQSQDPDEYLDALRLVAFADSMHASPEAKFVMGLLTYQVGAYALQAAWQVRSCGVVLLASDALTKSDAYLAQNGGIAPANALRLRESLRRMRANATELVQRRCL